MTEKENLPDIMQGDDRTFDLVFTDENDKRKSISGWNVFVTVKEDLSTSDANAEITKDVSGHDRPSEGETSFTFTATETSGLSGRHEYDIQIKDGNDDIFTVVEGAVEFLDEVTERTSAL